ncbi:MAG: HlyD family efflux transporter periplasmic adaptor subunit, partial [Planctomycetota bacterium]
MPRSLTRRSQDSRFGGIMGGLLVILAILAAAGFFGYQYVYNNADQISADDLIVKSVSRGPFDHIVLEQGEIESSSNIELVCEVESRGGGGTQILWVIEEGTKVTKGEKLVELDASNIELQLKEQRIKVIAAQSNLASAKATLEQAKISKQEYLEGVFETDKKTMLSSIAVAQQTLRKAELTRDSSNRLVAKGLIKPLQLEADNFAVDDARNKLEAEEAKLDVLERLTKQKFTVQYDSDIEAAKAKVSAQEEEVLEEEQDLELLKSQLENCVIYAPTDGVVVHANRYSGRGGNAEFVVEAGASVRERQAIIRLPDPNKMQIKCKVNESRVTLIRPGMAVRIGIDALPDLKLTGRVSKVNRYAAPGSWMTSSVKEYETFVEILDPPDVIRTGMTAEV